MCVCVTVHCWTMVAYFLSVVARFQCFIFFYLLSVLPFAEEFVPFATGSCTHCQTRLVVRDGK